MPQNVQVVSTVTSGGKRITSFSHMQTSTSTAMVNGVMADSNGNGHHDDDRFDTIAVNKDAPHSAIPTNDNVSSDSQAMDTEPSEENTNVEKSEQRDQQPDTLRSEVAENELTDDGSKTGDSPENGDRTDTVESSVSDGQMLDLSVRHDSSVPEPELDNERTSESNESKVAEADEESLSSSTDAHVHLNEKRSDDSEADGERKVTGAEAEQVDEGSSIPTMSTTTSENGKTSFASKNILSLNITCMMH